jgi:hypothetical protein
MYMAIMCEMGYMCMMSFTRISEFVLWWAAPSILTPESHLSSTAAGPETQSVVAFACIRIAVERLLLDSGHLNVFT